MNTSFRRLAGSRLFGAWGSTMMGRAISLIPIAVLLFLPELAGDIHVRVYVASFAYVAGVSYVWNVVNENALFSVRRTQARPRTLLAHCAITIGVFVVFVWSFRSAGLLSILLVSAAVAGQPVTAAIRAKVIDSISYKYAYGSVATRDMPAAVVALGALLTDSSFLSYLPGALLLGSAVQLAQLKRLSTSHASSAQRFESIRAPSALVAAASAIALAVYQPLTRLLAEWSPGPQSLVTYELAERPAYLFALALAGGVGTELQRRWRVLDSITAWRELVRASRLAAVGMMIGTAFTMVGAVLVVGPLVPALPYVLLILLPLCFLANLLFLIAVLFTRILFAWDRPKHTLKAYTLGLAIAVLTWLSATAALETRPLIVVPITAAAGFAVSLAYQLVAVRRILGEDVIR
jgi:hypothetical protein